MVNKTMNLIEQEVYDNLPPILKTITDPFRDRERDIILLSSLGVISACLPNTFGIYDSKAYFPNIYIFIIAPPASGKGVMNWSSILASKIHDELLEASRVEKISEQKKNKRDSSETFNLQLKIIPGNSSSAMVYNFLEHAEDSLLIFETEADSLSNMLKQDWGNFSDLLRKCFHHEKVSISRKTDQTYYEINNPKLSVVLSGTPDQIQTLINSKDNGLFSRFLFYTFDEVTEWKDVSPKNQVSNPEEIFEQLANSFLEFYKKLKAIPNIEIKLTDEQWEVFQDTIKAIDKVIIDDKKTGFTPTVRRLSLSIFRILIIFTILRNIDSITEDNNIINADDIDLKSCLTLFKVLIEHSQIVFDKDDKDTLKLSIAERSLLAKLPEEFTRREGLEVASILHFPERTYDEILKNWVEKNLIEKIKHGHYKKVNIN